MEDFTITQWNCQGLQSKKEDLIQIINNYKPSAFALQETMLNGNFSLPGYTTYNKPGHFNRKAHGGSAIIIHSSIPHKQLQLQLFQLQAIAIIASLNSPIILCSMYIPPSHKIDKQELTSLIQQLKSTKLPILIMGDFNAHHTSWGSSRSSQRGNQLLQFFDEHSLHVHNTGEPTHISYMSESCIDLTVSTLNLVPSVTWCAMESTYGSDHYVIKVTLTSQGVNQIENNRDSYNMKKTNWKCFKNHSTWTKIDNNITNIQESIDNLYSCIYEALDDSTPK